MAKSLNLAFALWGLGGPLGLHHLYLGRDLHFLLWFCSAGFFGLGWVAELCKMSGYVAQANRDPSYMVSWESRRGRKVQSLQISRWMGAFLYALYFELITVYALDAYVSAVAIMVVKSIMRAAAVYACFSIGEKTTNAWVVGAASVFLEFVVRGGLRILKPEIRVGLVPGDSDGYWFLVTSPMTVLVLVLVAFFFHTYRNKVRSGYHVCRRITVLLFFSSLWLLLFGSAAYHHLDVPTSTQKGSENKKLKFAIQEFAHSDTYIELRSILTEYQSRFAYGLSRLFARLPP